MENEIKENKKDYFLSLSILIAAILIAGSLIYKTGLENPKQVNKINGSGEINVVGEAGVALPINWSNFGKQLVEAGVIDSEKLEALYTQRGKALSDEEKQLLYGENNNEIKMTPQNAQFLLNLFWALGLANKNDILEKGPMSDPQYGDASRFASTGGWTLSKGIAMDHYSKHSFVILNSEQQALVERVAKGIYRPCCGNSTHFPDCNHGMAMLGLLELMASQGVSEEQMYQVALAVNSYWFPDNYQTIAKFFKNRGVEWQDVNPKDVLSSVYSSANGYQRILSEVEPVKGQGGGGCGV